MLLKTNPLSSVLDLILFGNYKFVRGKFCSRKLFHAPTREFATLVLYYEQFTNKNRK